MLAAVAAVVAVLALLLIARGCGGGLSADELRAEAARICVRANEATDRIAVPNEPAGGGRFLREARIQLAAAHRQLRALEPPDELAADYERAVRLAAREIALIWRHERMIEQGEDVIPAFRSLQQQLEPVVARENRLWRALDIPACLRR